MRQRWEPLHVTTEPGPEERRHSAGLGRHGAQDPGSFLASSGAHQCYRSPRVCEYSSPGFLFFMIIKNYTITVYDF